VFLGGLFWFGLFSLVNGFSKTPVMLCISRALQGIGAAGTLSRMDFSYVKQPGVMQLCSDQDISFLTLNICIVDVPREKERDVVDRVTGPTFFYGCGGKVYWPYTPKHKTYM
jgi:hypothetical protein